MSNNPQYDLLIIGGGPAGLTAALYGARLGLKTILFEARVIGGQAAEAPLIENYPGVGGVRGIELVNRMYEQAEGAGALIKFPEEVLKVDVKDKLVTTEEGKYSARAIIFATGAAHKKLGVPGEEELSGRGVSYCAVCDGPLFKGRRVAVVGGGNSAALAALYLRDIASEVYLIHRRDDLRADEVLKDRVLADVKVKVLWNTVVEGIEGEGMVERLRLKNVLSREEGEIEVDGVFIQVGEAPQSRLAKEAGLKLDGEGYIIVDKAQRTSVEMVYAAGDVAGGVAQVAKAVGEGATAAVNAYLDIRGGWYGKRP